MDNRIRMLATSITKLYRRGAERNIQKIIDKTHDADVASILENIDTAGRISVFQLISDLERQASILSHMGKSFQKEMAHILEISTLQKLLSQMESDDAADLLGYLPEEMSQKILKGLKKDELQDVEELMGYPEDSAGGLMSSEFLTMEETLKVSEAIAKIQDSGEDLITFYIYVTNEAEQLVGVLSHKQLLLSKPSDGLKNVMSTDVISVDTSTNQNDVAKIVGRYDFLSLPVVEQGKKLAGVITVDDVIDVIREEAADDFHAMGMAGATLDEPLWEHLRARFPWLLLAYIGGGFCYALLWNALKPFELEYMLHNSVSVMPLVFLTISTLSSQTVTMVVSFLRMQSNSRQQSWRDIKKEFFVGFSLSAIFALVFLVVAYSIQTFFQVPYGLSVLLALQMGGAVIVSMGIPLLIARLNFNPIVSAPSISMITSNILAVAILVAYYAFG